MPKKQDDNSDRDLMSRIVLNQMLLTYLLASCDVIDSCPDLGYELPQDFQTAENLLRDSRPRNINRELQSEIHLDFMYGRKEEIICKVNELDISDSYSGRILADFCLFLMQPLEIPDWWACIHLPHPAKAKKNGLNLPHPKTAKVLSSEDIQFIRFIVNARVNEFLGYWSAKMKEKKRARDSALVKTKTVKQNKEIVRGLLKINPRIDTDWIAEAMKAIDRGQRTVQELVKKIKEEEAK